MKNGEKRRKREKTMDSSDHRIDHQMTTEHYSVVNNKHKRQKCCIKLKGFCTALPCRRVPGGEAERPPYWNGAAPGGSAAGRTRLTMFCEGNI